MMSSTGRLVLVLSLMVWTEDGVVPIGGVAVPEGFGAINEQLARVDRTWPNEISKPSGV